MTYTITAYGPEKNMLIESISTTDTYTMAQHIQDKYIRMGLLTQITEEKTP